MTSQIADGATVTASSTTARKRGRPPHNIHDGAVVVAIERLFRASEGVTTEQIRAKAPELAGFTREQR